MVDFQLPDFDDMVSLTIAIREKQIALELRKMELATLKADITNFVTMNSNFWGADHKAPTNAHVKDTFHVVGYDETTRSQLMRLTTEIAQLEGELDYSKRMFSLLKIQTDIWRTQSANQRNSLI